MKKILLFTLLSASVISFTACADRLDTFPSNNTSEEVVFATADGAQAVMDGLYRYMYKAGEYTNGAWTSENFGLTSVMHCHDIVGDDMVKRDPGSQWFWYDHLYWVRGEITSVADRPVGWWTFFYKMISTSNSVIAQLPGAQGSDEFKNSVLGQALAMRAFAYYYLINIYQLTYDGNIDAPGVPLYTEPTDITTQGKARGTVADVYKRINDDLDDAITAFKAGSDRKHFSHVDLYTAYGFKARVALTQRLWNDAKDYAELALSKPGLQIMSSADVAGGFNSLNNPEWMWGAEIIEAQSTTTYSFFSHLDATEGGGYAKASAIQISRWLYDNMSDNDVRKTSWFNAPNIDLDTVSAEFLTKYKATTKQIALRLWEDAQNAENVADPSTGFAYPKNSYVQKKFRLKASGNWAADYLYMRASEMQFIVAEAGCMLNEYGDARIALNAIMVNRDPSYDAAVFADANVPTVGSYADDATFAARNLLDEVYFQRRVELWGEGFRCFDLMRQKIGVDRSFPETNFLTMMFFNEDEKLNYPDYPVSEGGPYQAVKHTYDADKWAYTMMIPMKEFNSNKQMNYSTDQNPTWPE